MINFKQVLNKCLKVFKNSYSSRHIKSTQAYIFVMLNWQLLLLLNVKFSSSFSNVQNRQASGKGLFLMPSSTFLAKQAHLFLQICVQLSIIYFISLKMIFIHISRQSHKDKKRSEWYLLNLGTYQFFTINFFLSHNWNFQNRISHIRRKKF